MSQQHLIGSPENTNQRIAHRGFRSDSFRLFHGEIHSPVLQLQRTLGNQRVAQLIQAKRLTPQGKIIGLQRKLTVGAAHDQYEQEAGRVADEMMRMPENTAFCGQQSVVSEDSTALPMKPGLHFANGPACGEEEVPQKRPIAISPLVQCQVEDEEEERIQTTEPDGVPSSIPSVGSSIASLRGSGKPPTESKRTLFEPRFGHDFSQVRLHTDGQAGKLAKTVHTKAFIVGRDVFLSQGEYSPGSSEGSGRLAHELTHGIPQERGPESKRHMHGPAALRHAQDRTVPSPDVVMRKVETSSPEVLSAFQTLCPSAMFTLGEGGLIVGRGCSDANKTCKCLCDAVTNSTLYQFVVSMASWSKRPRWMHDWSNPFIPVPSVLPHCTPPDPGSPGSPGNPGRPPTSHWTITLPSASSPGGFGVFDPSGNCIPAPFERLLAHELCGHAVPGIGSEEPGNRPSHDKSIDIENDIAKEQGWSERGKYGNLNQGESYSQKSGDPNIVYVLKDGWYYQTCTPPPENAPGQQPGRPKRPKPHRRQQKITNTENVRLVSDPINWAKDYFPFLIEKLPKGTTVKVLDKGAGEPFNQETSLEYQWWRVRAQGKEGWVMQVLLDDVTSP